MATDVPAPEYTLSKGIVLGKLAIVTGGASGMGRATCRILAREGAKVAILDINQAGAEETRELMGNVSEHLVVKTDVSKPDQVTKAFHEISAKFGRPADICINAAGVPTEFSLLDLPVEEFDRVISVNLKGTFLVMQAAVRAMVQGKVKDGAIVNFSSLVARTGNPAQSHYCASKAGVEAMSKTVAKELSPHGIRVNCVRPGVIDTPMLKAVKKEMIQAVMPLIPLQRMAQPHEVAEVVVFLASTRASYINATYVEADGGLNF